jgi:hypothetical protein
MSSLILKVEVEKPDFAKRVLFCLNFLCLNDGFFRVICPNIKINCPVLIL